MNNISELDMINNKYKITLKLSLSSIVSYFFFKNIIFIKWRYFTGNVKKNRL